MKKSKKQEVIDAAIDLFAEKGISKVSIANISKEIGATNGKVYHYFKKGKTDIIAAILKMYIDCVSKNVPDRKEWESKDADPKKILFGLFFEFSVDEALRLRKIVRIIMSEMYFNNQIAEHAKNYIIYGVENMLADCFQTLINNGKIAQFDVDSAARYFNRLMVVNAVLDALRFPFAQDVRDEEQNNLVIHDVSNFIEYVVMKK